MTEVPVIEHLGERVGLVRTKRLALICLIIMLSAFVSAKTLTVWLTGVNNEVLNIYRDLVEEKFTPVTGIEVEFTNLSWGDFENRLSWPLQPVMLLMWAVWDLYLHRNWDQGCSY